MLDSFWLTVLWALLTVVVSAVGFSVVTEKFLWVWSMIFNRGEHSAFSRAWKDLYKARKALSEISAQDEFAKWAKQQRVVDKLQAEVDKQKGAKQNGMMAKQVGLSLALRIAFYILGFWWLTYRCSGVSMTSLPENVFGPLLYVFSFPRLSYGELSAPILFIITSSALKRIQSAFFL